MSPRSILLLLPFGQKNSIMISLKEINVKLRACISSDYGKIYTWLFFSDIPYLRKEIKESFPERIPSPDDFRNDYPDFFFDGTAPEKGRSYIILSASGEEVGHISYTGFHLKPGIGELDIWLSRKKHIKKGFGPAAIRLLADDLFGSGYGSLIVRPSVHNEYAIRAYRKAGFYIIKPVLEDYYREEYIDLFGKGDWGEGGDLFMVKTCSGRRSEYISIDGSEWDIRN